MPGHPQNIDQVRIVDKDGHGAALIWDGTVWRLAVDASVSVVAIDTEIKYNKQIQSIDQALGNLPIGTTNLGSHDSLNYADFAVSVYLARIAADTTVDVVIQCSADNVNWREVDRQTLTLNATTTSANLNRNYSVTRQYMRVVLVNNTAACNAEVVTIQKPIG